MTILEEIAEVVSEKHRQRVEAKYEETYDGKGPIPYVSALLEIYVDVKFLVMTTKSKEKAEREVKDAT